MNGSGLGVSGVTHPSVSQGRGHNKAGLDCRVCLQDGTVTGPPAWYWLLVGASVPFQWSKLGFSCMVSGLLRRRTRHGLGSF